MFPCERKLLPKNKQRPLTAEEIVVRRQQAQLKRANAAAEAAEKNVEESATAVVEPEVVLPPEDDDAFVAFARIYSGTVKKGQQLYVLGPKHDPAEASRKGQNVAAEEGVTVVDLKPNQHVLKCTIDELFLLMGRELEALEEVPAGNVFGIGNLENHVLKFATLSSTVACPPFTDLQFEVTPIVRVALEPAHTYDMPALVKGLKLLNQADAAVQVFIQETGEHVIVTAGEVHLQRCLDDLRLRFAKVDINPSAPIVPFRETIVIPPTVDQVNELIPIKNQTKSKGSGDVPSEVITMQTSNKACKLTLRAVPLPQEVTEFLEENLSFLKAVDLASSKATNKITLSEEVLGSIHEFKAKLKELFAEAGKQWEGAEENVWAFGPRRQGPNILLGKVKNYSRPSVFDICLGKKLPDTVMAKYDGSFLGGFQIATLAGPLCDEPLRGVCFVVEDWEIRTKDENVDASEKSVPTDENPVTLPSNGEPPKLRDDETASTSSSIPESSAPFGPFSGQIMSAVKEGCRRAFQAQPMRLMTAMYTCTIQVTAEVLGRMYAVLGRRNGRVLASDLQEGSQIFNITATLPVIESFNFVDEMRKQTSGLAMPQLVFSHWEVVDTDPFWVPTTEEEYELYGEKADSENRARKYMNAVRRRKGLSVEEKLVEHAEKQRTLTRNK